MRRWVSWLMMSGALEFWYRMLMLWSCGDGCSISKEHLSNQPRDLLGSRTEVIFGTLLVLWDLVRSILSTYVILFRYQNTI